MENQDTTPVAVIQTTGLATQLMLDGGPIAFQVKNGLSLLWLKPKQAQQVVEMIFGCCGHGRRTARYATGEEINQWDTGLRAVRPSVRKST